MRVVTVTQLRRNFRKIIGRAELAGERAIVCRSHRESFALVPIDDLRFLETIENKLDVLEATKSIDDPGPSIPWDKAKQSLR